MKTNFKTIYENNHGNVGEGNVGERNLGSYNKGNNNIGWHNKGSRNVGDHNTGNYNTGCLNIGDYNTGNHNIGRANSGSGNVGNNNSGYFNTKEYIMLFDKKVPSGITIDYLLILDLLLKLAKDAVFNVEPFLKLPNATANKIKKLHKLHIEARRTAVNENK